MNPIELGLFFCRDCKDWRTFNNLVDGVYACCLCSATITLWRPEDQDKIQEAIKRLQAHIKLSKTTARALGQAIKQATIQIKKAWQPVTIWHEAMSADYTHLTD